MEQKNTSNSSIPEINNPAGIPSNHMTEDEFLALRGVGDTVSGVGIDRYAGANMFYLSNKQREKALSEISEQSNQYYADRTKAKEEYKALVSAGVIVPKTTEEQIITRAHGNPELEATQAARRMAKKHGIDWKTGMSLDLSRLNDKEIEALWDDLANIPFVEYLNGALCLDTDWYKYPAGTDREDIWYDFDKAHSKGVNYLLYERDGEMEAQNTERTDYSFYLYKDLSGVKDSMLLESNTVIAALEQNGETLATLEVRGEVSVEYKGQDYYSVREFPDDLKTLIAIDPYWQNNPDVYVSMNNWFELFDTNSYKSDIVNPEGNSLKEVYELMADGLNALKEEAVLPISYDDFTSRGGETIDYTQDDLKARVESLNAISYYIPELDINGSAEELFIEVRNGYCDNQPDKIAKIAELIENEAKVNNDTDLAKKAVIVRAAHELAVSDKTNPLNVAQMKYDILVNDGIFDVDGVPLDDSGNVVLTVSCDRDNVVFSAYDVYTDGNEQVTATGGFSVPKEKFLQYTQKDFDATVGSILCNNMIEMERTPIDDPKHQKDTISRD